MRDSAFDFNDLRSSRRSAGKRLSQRDGYRDEALFGKVHAMFDAILTLPIDNKNVIYTVVVKLLDEYDMPLRMFPLCLDTYGCLRLMLACRRIKLPLLRRPTSIALVWCCGSSSRGRCQARRI